MTSGPDWEAALFTLAFLTRQTMKALLTANAADFVLEQGGPLGNSANWIVPSAAVTDDGFNQQITMPATNSSQFFRLRRP